MLAKVLPMMLMVQVFVHAPEPDSAAGFMDNAWVIV
jgi:hypothetical protein